MHARPLAHCHVVDEPPVCRPDGFRERDGVGGFVALEPGLVNDRMETEDFLLSDIKGTLCQLNANTMSSKL